MACFADQVANLRHPLSSHLITATNLVFDLQGAQTFCAGVGAILGEVSACQVDVILRGRSAGPLCGMTGWRPWRQRRTIVVEDRPGMNAELFLYRAFCGTAFVTLTASTRCVANPQGSSLALNLQVQAQLALCIMAQLPWLCRHFRFSVHSGLASVSTLVSPSPNHACSQGFEDRSQPPEMCEELQILKSIKLWD